MRITDIVRYGRVKIVQLKGGFRERHNTSALQENNKVNTKQIPMCKANNPGTLFGPPVHLPLSDTCTMTVITLIPKKTFSTLKRVKT